MIFLYSNDYTNRSTILWYDGKRNIIACNKSAQQYDQHNDINYKTSRITHAYIIASEIGRR